MGKLCQSFGPGMDYLGRALAAAKLCRSLHEITRFMGMRLESPISKR
jgi:hypothetical protein